MNHQPTCIYREGVDMKKSIKVTLKMISIVEKEALLARAGGLDSIADVLENILTKLENELIENV